MSLLLPPKDHPARALIDVNQLADPSVLRAKLTGLYGAWQNAKACMANDSAIREVHCLCLLSDGALLLMRFTQMATYHVVWNFGTLKGV